MNLADRVRTIVKPGAAAPDGSDHRSHPSALASDAPPRARGTDGVESALGGVWREAAHGSTFVVERRFDGQTAHGRVRLSDVARTLRDTVGEAPLFCGGAPARAPFTFFDLETTGLSGGAGTQAFLVGCGRFEDDGAFVTTQYVLTRFADERPLLASVAAYLADAGALVSFNGKSFDAPVLETRYLFHRLAWLGGALPHIDVLHPARRFWGDAHAKTREAESLRSRPSQSEAVRARDSLEPLRSANALSNSAGGGAPAHVNDGGAPREAKERWAPRESPKCSLVSLEQQVLGARRRGDIAGFEIPSRYFQFVRTGDARPLAAVLQHNRLDLLSLAGLTARLLHLVCAGGAAASDAREALALGHVYATGGLDVLARLAYARALELCRSPAGAFDVVRIESLRALALMSRRARRYEDAAEHWRRLLDVRGCPPPIAREATEALAIHHEHRLRDLSAARTFALRNLDADARPAWVDTARHRLARIERKMAQASTLNFQLLPDR